MQTEYVSCGCGGLEHVLQLAYFKDDADYMYVSCHLSNAGFWRRLVLGVRYILGLPNKYGEYGEFVWERKQVHDFVAVAQQFLNEPSKP